MDTLMQMKRRILQMEDWNYSSHDDGESITHTDFQQLFVQHVLQHYIFVNYPPSTQFQRRFLKRYIAQIENANQEVLESIYDYYLQISNAEESQKEYCYKAFWIDKLEEYVIIKESVNMISHGTTGLSIWKAAFFLANLFNSPSLYIRLQTNAEDLEVILELGSGIGFSAIIISKLLDHHHSQLNKKSPLTVTSDQGHKRLVYASDYHHSVLKVLTDNFSINQERFGESGKMESEAGNDNLNHHHKREMKAIKLDWSDLDSINEAINEIKRQAKWKTVESDKCIDLIVASDVIYDNEIIQFFLNTVKILFGYVKHGVILGLTIRNPQTYQFFIKSLEEKDIKYEKIEMEGESLFEYKYDKKDSSKSLSGGTNSNQDLERVEIIHLKSE